MVRNLLPLFAMLVLGSFFVFAQQPPPSDYGVGNTHLSGNSDVGNDQSFSPDVNQAITDTRGATTEPQSGNPYFAGSSDSASNALSNGPAASSQTAVSTDARAAYNMSSSNMSSGNTQPGGQPQNNNTPKQTNANTNASNSKRKQAGSQRVTSAVPLNQGVSTTSTPGPSTAVPRNPVKERQRMPGANASQQNTTAGHKNSTSQPQQR